VLKRQSHPITTTNTQSTYTPHYARRHAGQKPTLLPNIKKGTKQIILAVFYNILLDEKNRMMINDYIGLEKAEIIM
jgi:hypothetical protein